MTLGLDARATPHDLRRSFASGCGDLAISRDVIKLLLNHKAEGITGEVYELSERWDEKAKAMERWSDKLIKIVANPAPDNVEHLRAAG